jgi:hypothetical protein
VEKLADTKAIQSLIIDNEQQFLSDCSDDHLRQRLEDMLEDDYKNLDIVETTIVQYGIQAEPKATVQGRNWSTQRKPLSLDLNSVCTKRLPSMNC